MSARIHETAWRIALFADRWSALRNDPVRRTIGRGLERFALALDALGGPSGKIQL